MKTENDNYALIVIYKLNKNPNYCYTFDSFALVKEDKYGYVVENGEFAGADDSYFSTIKPRGDEVVITDPRYEINDYAAELLTIDLDEIMADNYGFNPELLLVILTARKSFIYNWMGTFDNDRYSLSFKKNIEKVTYEDLKKIINRENKSEDKSLVSNKGENSNKKAPEELEKNKDHIRTYPIKHIPPTSMRKSQIGTVEKFKTPNMIKTNMLGLGDLDKNILSKESSEFSPQLENDIDINKIISETKKKIVGQDQAIESIGANIYANQRIIATGNRDLISTQKTSILLDGPTGTGKTAIIKEFADKLNLPIAITNSGSYSATGYVGDSLNDILKDLLKKANNNLELAQRGIVCLDEFDKLGGFSKDRELIMRRAIQQELLSFMSGTKIKVSTDFVFFKDNSVEFDTSNLTFICSGAFTGLSEMKIEEKKKKPIGFSLDTESEKENTYTITEQDYIDYGIERELMGRIQLITSTKAYSVEDLKRILLESTISPLKGFIEFVKSFGIKQVTYDDSFIEKVAQMAYDLGFGARGLHQIFANLKDSMLLDIINNKTISINLTTEMAEKSKEKNIRRY